MEESKVFYWILFFALRHKVFSSKVGILLLKGPNLCVAITGKRWEIQLFVLGENKDAIYSKRIDTLYSIIQATSNYILWQNVMKTITNFGLVDLVFMCWHLITCSGLKQWTILSRISSMTDKVVVVQVQKYFLKLYESPLFSTVFREEIGS